MAPDSPARLKEEALFRTSAGYLQAYKFSYLTLSIQSSGPAKVSFQLHLISNSAHHAIKRWGAFCVSKPLFFASLAWFDYHNAKLVMMRRLNRMGCYVSIICCVMVLFRCALTPASSNLNNSRSNPE